MQKKCNNVDAPIHLVSTLPLPRNCAHSAQANISLHHPTVSSMSYINPLFHFTSPDVSISAM